MPSAAKIRSPATPQARDSLRFGVTEFPYALVLENTVVGISYMRDRRFLWANARMAQIFGYEPGELDGQAVRVLYSTQADFEDVGRMFATAARRGGYTHERPMVKKNGDLLWCLISGRMIDPDDPLSPSVWVVQDITDKKRAEDQLRRSNQRLEQTVERRTLNLRRSNEALRAEVERRREAQELSVASREKYRALFRHVPLGVLVTNDEGDIVEVNRTLQSYLGASSRKALDGLVMDGARVVDHEGNTQSLARLVRNHAKGSTAGKVDRFEMAWMTTSGKRRDIAVVAAPMSGHGLGVAYAFADVTEQRQAREREHAQQAALTQAARQSLMGQMASALAHELGQPLNACQSYLGGLRHRLDEELTHRPELAQALDKAIGHLDQASDIIRNVRGFVSRHRPELEIVDLATLVQQTLSLLDIQLRAARVKVLLKRASSPTLVNCHPVEIQQVLVNLVVNAIDAMHEAAPDDRAIEIELGFESRTKVSLQVSDTGPGVPADVATRIFDPYFTTKSAGLGMGLMICRTIIESHGGALRLLSGHGQGAIFRFTLPVARDLVTKDGARKPAR
jgi:two-component system, LuxR family, sensor kinase FixL